MTKQQAPEFTLEHFTNHHNNIGLDDEMLNSVCGFVETHLIISDSSIAMMEVDDIILTWSEEGLEKDVRVAGEFSNWEPLTLSRCDDGKWRLR